MRLKTVGVTPYSGFYFPVTLHVATTHHYDILEFTGLVFRGRVRQDNLLHRTGLLGKVIP